MTLRKVTIILCLLDAVIWLVTFERMISLDSALEGTGFKPSVPLL